MQEFWVFSKLDFKVSGNVNIRGCQLDDTGPQPIPNYLNFCKFYVPTGRNDFNNLAIETCKIEAALEYAIVELTCLASIRVVAL